MLVKANNDNAASLSADQLKQLQQVIHQYSPLQLAWASGYLAAKSEGADAAALPAVAAEPQSTLTILYGSQTGNAKGVAEKVLQSAQSMGIAATLVNMGEYKPKNIKNETHLLIVTSTNGEGEPPDDAMALHEFLSSKRAPTLDSLQYSVLALGDSSYEFYCQTGKDFDQYLEKLGANRLGERVDCDVDYQADAEAWQNTQLEKVKALFAANTAQVVQLPVAGNEAATSVYSKENPFTAVILENQKITGRDSNKVVQHLEIDLADSGIQYQPGDALGIWPKNSNAAVTRIIEALSLAADESVAIDGVELSLADALISKREIGPLAKATLIHWQQLSDSEELAELLADAEQTRALINQKQFIDIVKQYPGSVSAQVLVDLLPALTPRLYSIASSQQEVDEEVHLTVGLMQFEIDGDLRAGTASSYLIEQLEADAEIDVFIEHNNNFRLPDNDSTDVIMIGPGTGVAPFRAFVQERSARGADGKNWLFFGDQTFTQDFLYQTEWQAYLKSGELTRLDVAFSRDQQQKVYVQHKLKQNAAAVYQWLEQGAHLYICGDMSRMAKDVHQALVDIIAEQGGKSQEQAEDYLKQMRIEKRYQKDVY
ncbi:assimilatory sulfite reductase (NADPH) flavoprotein subunit [Thalassotalea mangrovi]|uniref:Sulfite reductase [NADPH] flavoprotein alpha-component n=1 Tax=Thalassotalea mangrovi TaxID=2572245 RepID=A0A4U1B4I7_9GAMM|nr:assimilatory sulfite reductase (NADPH) flavoprotein subunit [Thalassotalea mangrovi]TKB45290.1 assimilatory sulfite reductase (NADPH) flavoprotein subunit [Thalassotalea mangrovi]